MPGATKKAILQGFSLTKARTTFQWISVLKGLKPILFKILRNIKHKNLPKKKKKRKEKNRSKSNEKQKQKVFPSHPPKKTLHFPSFLLLYNAIIHIEDTKVVQFKRKFHYIISGKELFTT